MKPVAAILINLATGRVRFAERVLRVGDISVLRGMSTRHVLFCGVKRSLLVKEFSVYVEFVCFVSSLYLLNTLNSREGGE